MVGRTRILFRDVLGSSLLIRGSALCRKCPVGPAVERGVRIYMASGAKDCNVVR